MPDKIPFMMGLAGVVPAAKVNITRIIEALVIGAICAVGTSMLLTRDISTKMDYFEKTRLEDRQLAAQDRFEIKADIKEVKDLVNDHILLEKDEIRFLKKRGH